MSTIKKKWFQKLSHPQKGFVLTRPYTVFLHVQAVVKEKGYNYYSNPANIGLTMIVIRAKNVQRLVLWSVVVVVQLATLLQSIWRQQLIFIASRALAELPQPFNQDLCIYLFYICFFFF